MSSDLDAPTLTDRYQLVDMLMVAKNGTTLREFVIGERRRGQVWRKITAAIIRITGNDLTEETVGGWFRKDEDVIAAWDQYLESVA